MSKLPVISGAECVRALGKIGFAVHRQRGSHITVVAKTLLRKQRYQITKNWIVGPYGLSFGKPD